jgi:hypothetical protein
MNTNYGDGPQAAASLAEVERRRAEVQAADAAGRRILLGWAVIFLLTLPLFDHLQPTAAGIVLTCVAIIGAIASGLYGSRSRVASLGSMRRWSLTWVLWTPWFVALILLLTFFGHRLSFAWTLGAVAAALPLAAVAILERRR